MTDRFVEKAITTVGAMVFGYDIAFTVDAHAPTTTTRAPFQRPLVVVVSVAEFGRGD